MFIAQPPPIGVPAVVQTMLEETVSPLEQLNALGVVPLTPVSATVVNEMLPVAPGTLIPAPLVGCVGERCTRNYCTTTPHGKLASTVGFDEFLSASHAAPSRWIVMPFGSTVQSVP